MATPLDNISKHPHFPVLVAVASYGAFQAGFVNGVFLIASLTFVSSVNGLLSLVARDYLTGNAARASTLLAQIVTFFAGAVVAGVVYERQLRWRISNAIGVAAISLGIFLTVGIYSLNTPASLTGSVFTAAFTMGFQNAMSSFFSKSAFRTTHQSGAVTDLGLLLGQWLRGRCCPSRHSKSIEAWRVYALLPTVAAFFAGGFAGIASVTRSLYLWMLLPSGLSFIAAVAYIFVHLRRKGRRAPAAVAVAATATQPEG